VAQGAYLLYLAWQTLQDQSAIQVEDNRAPVSFRRVIRTAVLINLLNPKLTIFFIAFLPQFVPADQPNGTWQMIGLSGVFMALTFVVFALYGVFAATSADPGDQPPQSHVVAAPTFAATYVLLAGRLAAESR
jgi:threonine/homoserine/homoserine lactone efflux protein